MSDETQTPTPRTQKIMEAINATLKPYAEKYFGTATAMLLINQYLEIEKIEVELAQVKRELEEVTAIMSAVNALKQSYQRKAKALDWLGDNPARLDHRYWNTGESSLLEAIESAMSQQGKEGV